MTGLTEERPIVIIEDSDVDFEVTVWAIREAGIANPVHRCADSADIEELLAWPPGLRGLAKAEPILVILDLNLPGVDWQDVLVRLRTAGSWRTVPVVILSTSQQPATVMACYVAGAAGYLRKSIDLNTFALTIRNVVTYWLHTVVPPPFSEETKT